MRNASIALLVFAILGAIAEPFIGAFLSIIALAGHAKIVYIPSSIITFVIFILMCVFAMKDSYGMSIALACLGLILPVIEFIILAISPRPERCYSNDTGGMVPISGMLILCASMYAEKAGRISNLNKMMARMH